jgi:HEAT repeat protein
LLRALGSDWGLLQLSAATALGGLGSRGEMAIPALADQILFCENGEVREAAADALGQIGPRSLPILEQFLQDSDPSVRRLAIRGLVAEGDNEAAPSLLIHGLSDEDAGNRTAAATALFHREQPSPEVWGVLLTALGSRERNVRISAYRTLQTRPKDLASHRGRLLELSQNRLAPVQSQEAARRLLELCPE